MGNKSSSTTDENPTTTTKPVPKRISVRGSVYRGYEPSAWSPANSTNSESAEKNPVINDKRNSDSRIQSKSKTSREPVPSRHSHQQLNSPFFEQPPSAVPDERSFSSANKEYSTPVSTREHSSSVLLQKSLSPGMTKQQQASPSYTNSPPNTIMASSFEKAPMVQLNYVVKSSDNNSIHTYAPGNITVMQRVSTQSVPHGSKWYENDYNKDVKPLVVKYL